MLRDLGTLFSEVGSVGDAQESLMLVLDIEHAQYINQHLPLEHLVSQ